MRMTISETYPDDCSLLKLVSTFFLRKKLNSNRPKEDSMKITSAKSQVIKAVAKDKLHWKGQS